jgi:hypothetical protein
MEQMQQMLQNVSRSIEAQDMRRKDYEAEIKQYQAETQRITATQAGMSEEQIQDIAMGVVAAAMESQSMMNQMPEMRQEPMPMEMMQPEQGMMPPEQGMPQ